MPYGSSVIVKQVPNARWQLCYQMPDGSSVIVKQVPNARSVIVKQVPNARWQLCYCKASAKCQMASFKYLGRHLDLAFALARPSCNYNIFFLFLHNDM
jgi:adenosine/AMP kinase